MPSSDSSKKPLAWAKLFGADFELIQSRKVAHKEGGALRRISKSAQVAVYIDLVFRRKWDSKTKSPSNHVQVTASRIAKSTDLGVSTVSLALKALQSSGHLRIDYMPGRSSIFEVVFEVPSSLPTNEVGSRTPLVTNEVDQKTRCSPTTRSPEDRSDGDPQVVVPPPEESPSSGELSAKRSKSGRLAVNLEDPVLILIRFFLRKGCYEINHQDLLIWKFGAELRFGDWKFSVDHKIRKNMIDKFGNREVYKLLSYAQWRISTDQKKLVYRNNAILEKLYEDIGNRSVEVGFEVVGSDGWNEMKEDLIEIWRKSENKKINLHVARLELIESERKKIKKQKVDETPNLERREASIDELLDMMDEEDEELEDDDP